MSVGTVDWLALAAEVGTISADQTSIEHGGTMYAQHALEKILGPENIRSATELVLNRQYGSELARNVLVHICSGEALEIAYQAYKIGDKERLASALLLIKDLFHPKSMEWMEEFLRDDDPMVVSLGLSVLEDLIWFRAIRSDDERIVPLLGIVASHDNEQVRDKATHLSRNR